MILFWFYFVFLSLLTTPSQKPTFQKIKNSHLLIVHFRLLVYRPLGFITAHLKQNLLLLLPFSTSPQSSSSSCPPIPETLFCLPPLCVHPIPPLPRPSHSSWSFLTHLLLCGFTVSIHFQTPYWTHTHTHTLELNFQMWRRTWCKQLWICLCCCCCCFWEEGLFGWLFWCCWWCRFGCFLFVFVFLDLGLFSNCILPDISIFLKISPFGG